MLQNKTDTIIYAKCIIYLNNIPLHLQNVMNNLLQILDYYAFI